MTVPRKIIINDEIIETFNRLFKTPKSKNKCWPWPGTKSKDGYGRFYIIEGEVMKFYIAHRVAYAIYYNLEYLTDFVLHKCSDRSCVNPKHLIRSSVPRIMKSR